MNAPLLHRPLTVRAATPADDARVVDFVRDHAASPFHLPAWGRAVANACRQQDRSLIAERGERVVGVLPLTLIGSPLFGRALVSAGFAVDGGVVADRAEVSRELLDAAWGIASAGGATSLELRGGEAPGAPFVTATDQYLGFARPLADDDEAELLAIPRKQRAEVRKALANDLQITVGAGADDLRAHYAVYSQSVRNLGTPVFPRALFAQVLQAMDADILTVRHRGVAVASVLSLYWQGVVYPYWGGGTQAARALRANDAMYYALMGHARRRGCTRFDFGRSKVGTGPAAFKHNWGFTGEPLAYHVRTADGVVPRSVNPLDPKYQRKIALWKKLPLPIANLVGPLIARGLG